MPRRWNGGQKKHQQGFWSAMYLLVFFTLMIAIIGMYTQVLGLQAARFASNQSGIGSTMLQWHTAAVSMAVSILKTNPGAYPGAAGSGPGAVGCSLTFNAPPGTSMAACPSPQFMSSPPYSQAGTGNINGTSTGGGTITDGSSPPKLYRINYFHQAVPPPPATPTTAAFFSDECVHLSATCAAADTGANNNGCQAGQCATTYDTTDYQFYSILYQDSISKQNYVVTFLPAPVPSTSNPAPGYLFSASPTASGAGTNLGIGASDLLRQLSNAGEPSYAYGSFSGFSGTPQLVTSSITYNLPASGNFKLLCNASTTCQANGAVAVVGYPDGF